jgi:septum formation protein
LIPRRLILASASPRRQSLLREAGYEFHVHAADLDEDRLTAEARLSPDDLPAYLARAKARAVIAQFPGDVMLAADTVVALGNQIIGKAADAADARRILSMLSGTRHRVITGIVVVSDFGVDLSETVSSTVEMRPLSPGQIDSYISTGQWRGKAGAYGLQDSHSFVEKIEGCATNIVGLPITTAARLLGKAGIHPARK